MISFQFSSIFEMNKFDISMGIEKYRIVVENEIDNILPSPFEYTKCSIPSCSIPMDDLEVQYCGCKCSLPSNESENSISDWCKNCNCECIKIKNFGSSSYSTDHRLQQSIFNNFNAVHQPVFECNDACLCPADKCSNRVVQNGIACNLSIFKSKDKGWCLKTLQAIPKGTFVCEYAGEILTYSEAKQRILSQSKEDKNYIYVLNEHLGNGNVISTYVDPTNCGNVGRFANHSCEPNLIMIPVRINNSIPRLALFAKIDINANEELHFDYSGNQSIFQSSDQTWKPCFCNSLNCKKSLPCDETLFRL